MIVIDKVKQYLRSISTTETEYQKLLSRIWINPKFRNEECQHPEYITCDICPLNHFHNLKKRGE